MIDKADLKKRGGKYMEVGHTPLDNCDAFCKLSNPLKQPHLLSNSFRILPCKNAASLDCIYNNYNLFKSKFKCGLCNQEHKFPKEFQVPNSRMLSDLLNQDLLRVLNDKTKNLFLKSERQVFSSNFYIF